MTVFIDIRKVHIDTNKVYIDIRKVHLDIKAVYIDTRKVHIDTSKVYIDIMEVYTDIMEGTPLAWDEIPYPANLLPLKPFSIHRMNKMWTMKTVEKIVNILFSPSKDSFSEKLWKKVNPKSCQPQTNLSTKTGLRIGMGMGNRLRSSP
jgi:hypothetical protein